MLRCLWLIPMLLLLQAPCRAGSLRAGVGRAEIAAPAGTPLGGYSDRKGAPSTGVHDPIQAKALVLDDGTTRVAIITTDLVGVSPDMAARVSEAAPFPRDHLVICASHTHSGPGAYGRGAFATIALGAFRTDVLDSITGAMTRALKEAVASLGPAKLAVGQSEAPGFMRNRRKTKLIDPALWLMRVDRADGKPLGALVNLTAHGTILGADNMKMSGDWMGATQAAMEREVPGLLALYANGAEGDISPNAAGQADRFETAREHGERGARAALDLYRSLKPAEEVRLEVRSAPLDLPQTLTAALAGAGKQTTLTCLRINDALLITVPGEMITQLGLALKEHARRQGVRFPAIVGLANDHLGYLLTRDEMKRGGYESKVSFFGDGFGEELTLALARLIGGDVEPVKAALSIVPEHE
jgi:neutral ceramidase